MKNLISSSRKILNDYFILLLNSLLRRTGILNLGFIKAESVPSCKILLLVFNSLPAIITRTLLPYFIQDFIS